MSASSSLLLRKCVPAHNVARTSPNVTAECPPVPSEAPVTAMSWSHGKTAAAAAVQRSVTGLPNYDTKVTSYAGSYQGGYMYAA